MRYLTAFCPEVRRVLLVESGSRSIVERAIPRLRGVFGPEPSMDLLTCYGAEPDTLESGARIWRTQEYTRAEARRRLLGELASVTVLAIVCSGEPVMARWKWWLAWKLGAKVLIVNENADCFWLDLANLRPLRQLFAARLGLAGGGGRTLSRIAMLPLVFAFLLLYATFVHARRAIRIAWSTRGK